MHDVYILCAGSRNGPRTTLSRTRSSTHLATDVPCCCVALYFRCDGLVSYTYPLTCWISLDGTVSVWCSHTGYWAGSLLIESKVSRGLSGHPNCQYEYVTSCQQLVNLLLYLSRKNRVRLAQLTEYRPVDYLTWLSHHPCLSSYNLCAGSVVCETCRDTGNEEQVTIVYDPEKIDCGSLRRLLTRARISRVQRGLQTNSKTTNWPYCNVSIVWSSAGYQSGKSRSWNTMNHYWKVTVVVVGVVSVACCWNVFLRPQKLEH